MKNLRLKSPRIGLFANGYEAGSLSARLIGVPFPSSRLFLEENLQGVRWITCLSSVEPQRRYETSPWKLGFLDRVNLNSPLGVDRSKKVAVVLLARRIIDRLRMAEGVLIHCDMGIERTGAVLGTVLAMEGYSPQRVALGIADAVEGQQPEWAGPRFPEQLASCIEECLALSPAS